MRPNVYRPAVAVLILATFLPSLAFGQASRAGVITTLEGNVTVASVSAPQPRPLKFSSFAMLYSSSRVRSSSGRFGFPVP